MTPQRRRPPVNRHFKIDRLLKPEDLGAYRAFLREPSATVDTAHAWLNARGYAGVSRSAVARHKRLLLERDEEHDAQLRRAAAYARLAGTPGAPDLAAGAMLCAEHLVFERVWDFKREKELGDKLAEPAEVREVLELVAALIQTRRQFDEFKKALARSIGPETASLTPGEEPEEQEALRKTLEILDHRPRGTKPGPTASGNQGSPSAKNGGE